MREFDLEKLQVLGFFTFFTLCGPCIVIHLRNKDQQDTLLFLNLFH